jgi:hypothetical protein
MCNGDGPGHVMNTHILKVRVLLIPFRYCPSFSLYKQESENQFMDADGTNPDYVVASSEGSNAAVDHR